MNQMIILQPNATKVLFPLLAKYKVQRFLLVCDKAFPLLKLSKAFDQCPVPFTVFDQFTSNPLYEDVCRGVALFRKEKCNAIVAIGGGSSLETAKCIKLFSPLKPNENYRKQALKENHIPLIAVPTTSGTGSESTRYAVIYHDGIKQSVFSPAAIPDVAILDAEVLDTLPIYQKKCTMMDALCHGIESWWSINSTEESRELSRRAVCMILDSMMNFLDNQPEANENMLKAANLAGQAINITQTTAAHAMSYKLTSLFGVPHGRAAAVCLPYVWQYMTDHPEQCSDTRGPTYLNGIFTEISKEIGCSNWKNAPDQFYTLVSMLFQEEPPITFRMEELPVLVQSVNPVRLKNNPVLLSQAAVQALYLKILKKQWTEYDSWP